MCCFQGWSRAVDYVRETDYWKGLPGQYTAYVWTDFLSSEGLVKCWDEAERVTREALKLEPIRAVAARQFEHSMGQGGELSGEIWRSSDR